LEGLIAKVREERERLQGEQRQSEDAKQAEQRFLPHFGVVAVLPRSNYLSRDHFLKNLHPLE
jgi:hypothetical protein